MTFQQLNDEVAWSVLKTMHRGGVPVGLEFGPDAKEALASCPHPRVPTTDTGTRFRGLPVTFVAPPGVRVIVKS